MCQVNGPSIIFKRRDEMALYFHVFSGKLSLPRPTLTKVRIGTENRVLGWYVSPRGLQNDR